MDGKSLSEISGVPEPGTLSEILPSSYRLAKNYIHKGQRRLTGEHAIRHPERVKERTEYVLRDTEHKIAGCASAYLHEAGEDKKGIVVLKPRALEAESDALYLSDFYQMVREEGDKICYMVDKMTHSKDVRYIIYMGVVFSLAPSGKERDCDIITLIEKIIDRHNNTNPEERIDRDYYREVHRRHEKNGTLTSLRDEYGLSRYTRRGGEIPLDAFLKALDRKLIHKVVVNSLDNIVKAKAPKVPYPYVHVARRVLLEETDEKDRRLFYPERMKEIIDELEHNSDIILKKYGHRIQISDLLGDTGFFR
jgi:hypothetical protein